MGKNKMRWKRRKTKKEQKKMRKKKGKKKDFFLKSKGRVSL